MLETRHSIPAYAFENVLEHIAHTGSGMHVQHSSRHLHNSILSCEAITRHLVLLSLRTTSKRGHVSIILARCSIHNHKKDESDYEWVQSVQDMMVIYGDQQHILDRVGPTWGRDKEAEGRLHVLLSQKRHILPPSESSTI